MPQFMQIRYKIKVSSCIFFIKSPNMLKNKKLNIPISFVDLISKSDSINNGQLQVHIAFLQLCT